MKWCVVLSGWSFEVLLLTSSVCVCVGTCQVTGVRVLVSVHMFNGSMTYFVVVSVSCFVYLSMSLCDLRCVLCWRGAEFRTYMIVYLSCPCVRALSLLLCHHIYDSVWRWITISAFIGVAQ